MKTLTPFVFAAVLLAPLSLSAASFEGKVALKITGPRGGEMPMTMSLKSGLVRVDMQTPGRTMSMITDPAKQQVTILVPDQQMYMVHSLPKIEPPDPAKADDVKIEKTDQHEKILGYDTTKYIATTKQGTNEIWVTDQLGAFPHLGGPMGGRPGRGARLEAWEQALQGKDAFPLRVVTTNGEGKETFRLEATSIEKATLPASLFAPPSDYQEMNMEKMMGGMRQGMPPGSRPTPPPPADGK